MPKSAVENGSAREVVPLTQIAEAIVKHVPNQTHSCRPS
jgi:chemotaxis response regulator CheB